MRSPEKFSFQPEQTGESLETEQKKLDSIRKQHRYQERPAFFDETVLKQGKDNERRKPTDIEKEQMNNNMRKLGDVFENSAVRWQLDGAFNISLLKGEYIGVHKDVDLTIDPDDLEKLEKQLFQKGYGFFLSSKHDDPKKRKMEWVSANEFREAPEEHLMIVALDEQGKISNEESLNYIDVHLIKRGKDGKPLGFGRVALPEKWYEPQKITFQDKEIYLSHPAKTAYFKIHGTRELDRTDLQDLAETGGLTLDDIDEIENILEQEFENRKTLILDIIKRIAPEIGESSGTEEIFAILMKNEDISERLKKEEDKQRVYELAERIAEQEDKSLENIGQIALDTVNIEEEIIEQRKELQSLRQKVSNVKKNIEEGSDI